MQLAVHGPIHVCGASTTLEPQNVRRTGASAWLNMAAKLAAELEDLEPAPCRRQASLVAMSECGDLLVVTSGNTLRYGHCSCGDLRIVPVSIPIGELDGTTLHSVRFNSSADAILLTGPHFLCLAQARASVFFDIGPGSIDEP